VLFVATAAGAAVVADAEVVLTAAPGVACAPGACVAGTDVTIAAGVATGVATVVAGCAGVDEVHPAKNAVSNNNPQTIPMMRVCLVFKSCFIVDLSIAYYFSGDV
jgi:hypothetical protein